MKKEFLEKFKEKYISTYFKKIKESDESATVKNILKNDGKEMALKFFDFLIVQLKKEFKEKNFEIDNENVLLHYYLFVNKIRFETFHLINFANSCFAKNIDNVQNNLKEDNVKLFKNYILKGIKEHNKNFGKIETTKYIEDIAYFYSKNIQEEFEKQKFVYAKKEDFTIEEMRQALISFKKISGSLYFKTFEEAYKEMIMDFIKIKDHYKKEYSYEMKRLEDDYNDFRFNNLLSILNNVYNQLDLSSYYSYMSSMKANISSISEIYFEAKELKLEDYVFSIISNYISLKIKTLENNSKIFSKTDLVIMKNEFLNEVKSYSTNGILTFTSIKHLTSDYKKEDYYDIYIYDENFLLDQNNKKFFIKRLEKNNSLEEGLKNKILTSFNKLFHHHYLRIKDFLDFKKEVLSLAKNNDEKESLEIFFIELKYNFEQYNREDYTIYIKTFGEIYLIEKITEKRQRILQDIDIYNEYLINNESEKINMKIELKYKIFKFLEKIKFNGRNIEINKDNEKDFIEIYDFYKKLIETNNFYFYLCSQQIFYAFFSSVKFERFSKDYYAKLNKSNIKYIEQILFENKKSNKSIIKRFCHIFDFYF